MDIVGKGDTRYYRGRRRRVQSFRTAPALTPLPKARADAVANGLIGWGPVRTFPWRATVASPWRTLLAEMLLVRTSADAVAGVIELLWERYPTSADLVAAPGADVATVIAPLGLAKRAGQLMATARAVDDLGGVPHERAVLLALRGVGDYVADAVRLFGFGEPVVPVDAVIGRVLRRVFAYPDHGPAYDDRGLRATVQPLAAHGDPGRVTQALLDLGALVCVPVRPRCPVCPIADHCRARPAFEGGASLDARPGDAA